MSPALSRSRLLALWFVALLALSTMPGFIPLASATPSGSMRVDVIVDGMTVTASTIAHIGSRVWIIANVTDTFTSADPTKTECAGGSPMTSVIAQSGFESIGGTNGAAFNRWGSDTSSSGTWDLNLTVAAGTTTNNLLSVTLTPQATIACVLGTTNTSSTSFVKSGAPFNADTQVPAATAKFSCPSKCGIDDPLIVNVTTNDTDIAPVGNSLDLRQSNGTIQPVNVQTGLNNFSFIIRENQPNIPMTLKLRDVNGNEAVIPVTPDVSGTIIDTVRPATIPVTSVTAVKGNALLIDISASTDTGVGPSDYFVNESPASGGATRALRLNETGNLTLDSAVNQGGAKHLILRLLPISGFDSGPQNLAVFVKDSVGNPSFAVNSTGTPAASPATITITPQPQSAKAFATPSGTFTTTSSVEGGSTTIKLWLLNLSDPVGAQRYWTGGAPALASSWSTSKVTFNLTNTNSTVGTWNGNVLEPTAGATGTNAKLLAEQSYRIGVDYAAAGTVIDSDSYVFLYDHSAPTYSALAPGTNNFGSNVASGVPQGSTINFAVNATDLTPAGTAGSGIASVSFELRSAASGNPSVTDAFGNPAVMACGSNLTNGCKYGNDSISTVNNFRSNVTLQLPAVTFGSYVLVTSVTDLAGNTAVSAPSAAFAVIPRVRLVDLIGTPSNKGGGVEAFIYAGYSGLSTLDAGAPCASQICPVTAVEFYGRNASTSASAPGSTGVILLWNALTPRSSEPGPVVFNTTSVDTLGYYNYSNLTGQPYPFKGLNPQGIQVMALARVTVGSTQYIAMSPWTPLSRDSLVNFTSPNNDSFVFMDTVDGSAMFNLTFDKAGLDAAPTLKYVVYDKTTNASITSSFNSTTTGILPLGPLTGPRYFFNFSNAGGALPRGEYGITAWVNGTVQNLNVSGSASRFFAVEEQSPMLDLNIAQPEIFHDSYVPRVFNLSYSLNTGYANFTNLSKFNVTLTAPNQLSSGTYTLTNASTSGFRYWLNGTSFDPANTTSVGRITIRLPDNASDGSQYFVRVNVTTDSSTMGGGASGPLRNGAWLANATAQRGVFVDVVPAASGVYLDFTNKTGEDPNVQIRGFATDYGSGVKTMRVRIVDLNASTCITNFAATPLPSVCTFDINANSGQGGFVQNESDSWLSSAPLALASGGAVADVYLDGPVGGVNAWFINSTPTSRALLTDALVPTGTYLPAIPFNRNHTYRIDVTAADQFNPFPPFTSSVIAFDASPPAFSSTGLFSAPSTVGWHGSGTLSVNVSDNLCMLRVSLMGTTPSGQAVPRADFTPSDPTATCGRPNVTVPQAWTLQLAQFPNVTNEIGAYNLSVEAVDASGRVTRDTHNLTLKVTDTQPAVVRYLTLVPPVVATGGRSIVRAEVFENQKLLFVNATFARLLPGGSVDTAHMTRASHTPGDAQAANGTGFYEFWSDTDMMQNLTVGDYLWRIQAVDANFRVTCPGAPPADFCDWTNIIVRVADSTTPFVQQDSPAPGATVIGASPNFHWRVIGANITAGGITLRTGPVNGTLAPASPAPNVTALAPVGNVATGFDVTFTPGSLAGVANYSVNLTATNVNGVSGSSAADYLVDALPPTASHSVSNAVVINGVTYATSTTRITLNATDNETSIASLTYKLNGGPSIPYTAPFAVTGPDGTWQADYVATDLGGNTANGSITLHVDATPPVIALARGGDSILLTVSDAGVGVDESNVSVHYAYGTSPTFTVTKATKVAGNSYQAQLPGNATATGLRYYFDAKDLLGNLGSKNTSANPLVIEKDQPPQNLAPKLTITAPANGSEWRGSVDLKWIAEDPEGQPITIAIALREPVGTGSFLVTNGNNTGLYRVDLANKPSGSYTLVLTATDGVQSAQGSVTFTVPTQRPQYECLSCPTSAVEPGKPISFGIGLNPVGTTVASATYNVTRDGQVVSTGIMKQQQGAWVLSYTPTSAGKYKVFVTEVDANGTAQPAHEVSAFEVQGATPISPLAHTSNGVPPSFLALIAIGVLTIAVAAYGAFVRWK